MNDHRRKRLRSQVAAARLDALIASSPANIQYATGIQSATQSVFPSVQLFAVIDADGNVPAVVVPYGDVPSVLDESEAPWDVVCYGRLYFEPGERRDSRWNRALRIQEERAYDTFAQALAAALAGAKLDGARLGLDEARLTPERWRAVADALPHAHLSPAYEIFRRVRRIKGPDEVERLERAARVAEDALAEAVATAREGVTEREMAGRYRAAVLSRGADPYLYVTTFGERAALADTYPTDRPLRAGDAMRFDVGCVVEGYVSDIARTAVLGEPPAKLEQTYAAMLAGEDALIAATRPGNTGQAIFDAGMEAARGSGVAHYRRHHCGHGIGLEVYELPLIAPGHADALEPGMTFCLETPYYELGWGGAQVEDAVVVSEDGCRVLNRSSRELWRAGEG
ncbi:MAG: M24 family metallopeptidase [Candidatus Limnocylindria bacterium]